MSVRGRRPGAPEFAEPGTARNAQNTAHSAQNSQGSAPLSNRANRGLQDAKSLPDLGQRTRPRPGKTLPKSIDIQSKTKPVQHELGRWSKEPQAKTKSELWYNRWKSMQPDPSFDIDGDGVVSSLDLYLAKQFDRDGNGVLDTDETRTMRRILAQKGIDEYAKIPHGPHIEKLTASINKSLFDETPRINDPTEALDPNSDTWHLKMNSLTNKTRVASHFNSDHVKTSINHSDMEAKPINMMEVMCGKGVHAMMGSGWRAEDQHTDVYDKDIGWIDRKVGPKEVRDQDQDWTTDAEGNKVRRDNPILEGFQDQQKIHDPAALRMHQAGERMLEENELFDNTRIRGANAPQPKHGRLAKPEKKSLRRLFNQLDVDRNGTLDEHELVALAAAGGKKLSRRQLAEAMAEMDADGSGSVEYEEFEKWWEHGAQHPPQGTEVFRRITAQLETKFSNLRGVFRKFDENHDGTLSHHEFRKGLELAGIPLEDQEFKDLLKTLDEDNSNEIDYNEFADSGMMGGKYFAARDPKGFSGCTTKAGLLDKRKRVERAFGQDKMNTLWSNTMSDPKVAIGQLVWAGGGGM